MDPTMNRLPEGKITSALDESFATRVSRIGVRIPVRHCSLPYARFGCEYAIAEPMPSRMRRTSSVVRSKMNTGKFWRRRARKPVPIIKLSGRALTQFSMKAFV